MSGELSASLDPRQVATLIARHLALAMGVDECAISYWDRPGDRLATLGYYPPMPDDELQPYFDLAAFPASLHVLRRRTTVAVDTADPGADPAEVALLEVDGYRSVVMLPLVAKGQSIGLVELISRSAVAARRRTRSRSRGRWRTRRRWRSRTRASTRRPARSPTATR